MRMSTENKVDIRIALFYFLPYVLLLHHTAAKHNYHIGIFCFQRLECTDITENSVVCVLTDCTSIIKHKVCTLDILGKAVSDKTKPALKTLTVRHITLTAECMNIGKFFTITHSCIKHGFCHSGILTLFFYIVKRHVKPTQILQ